ncbi:MAG: polysaccharide deacetylase [Acidimicrobiia bacterium]|nr:polysaccharide deacetylase [Acidimicrobiia bacterium]
MSELVRNENGYVCLSFDFDGPSLWMQRRMTTPMSVSRGEFGRVAVPRILRMLERRGIPATFFIPGHTIETYPDECKMVVDAGCEVGLHGYAHEFNPVLSAEKERWVMEKSVELLDKLTGAPPVGYRAPSGDPTAQTIGLLEEFGVRYDSSLMGDDYRPYMLRNGDTFPEDQPAQWGPETSIAELPFSWTLDDYVYLEFVIFRRMMMPGLRKPEDMFDNFFGDIDWMVDNVGHGVCNVVFHPQVIGRGHRMRAMEQWLDRVEELGVGFARMDTVAQAYLAGQPFGTEPR